MRRVPVLASPDDLVALGATLYPDEQPRPFQLLGAALRVRNGEDAKAVAESVGSTRKRLESLAAESDPTLAIFGTSLSAAAQPEAMQRPRGIMGQLLLGDLAERAFESIYRTRMGTEELVLEDDRSSRNETDYRVLNGQRRPVFRINIKFHGSPFRKAEELVKLQPEDCFALATYKIWQGLKKHEDEHLPYVFVIVGVPGLTGSAVGAAIPERFAHLISLVHNSPRVDGKRAIEERVIGHLLETPQEEPFGSALADFRRRIGAAAWYVLSARRADTLLREKLFERVFAVRVRGFARNYRNAELDMHFSLSQDLTPLPRFLDEAKSRGLHGLAVDLERGVL